MQLECVNSRMFLPLYSIKRMGNIYRSVTQCYHLQFPCFGILLQTRSAEIASDSAWNFCRRFSTKCQQLNQSQGRVHRQHKTVCLSGRSFGLRQQNCIICHNQPQGVRSKTRNSTLLHNQCVCKHILSMVTQLATVVKSFRNYCYMVTRWNIFNPVGTGLKKERNNWWN